MTDWEEYIGLWGLPSGMRVRGEVEVKRREAVLTLTECRVNLLLVTVLALLPKKKGRNNSGISY